MNVNNSNKKRIESKTGTKRNTIISLSQERTQNQDPIQASRKYPTPKTNAIYTKPDVGKKK